MDVTCLLFAVAREKAGVERVKLELPPGSRTGDAIRELAHLFPVLDAVVARSRIAVNGVFTDPEQKLASGDEVAIIPPVSGG